MVFETIHGTRSNLTFHRHGIAFATIVVAGQYTEVRDGVPSLQRAGSIVVHSSNEEHADFFSDAARCVNVELPRDFGLRPLHVSQDAAIAASVASVVRAFERSASAAPLAGPVADLCDALAMRRDALERSRPAWLHRVIAAFDWVEAVPLREAARLAGVHPAHFARAFARHTGMTPSEYRREARLRRATELLLRSTDSFVRIALASGFGDQSHFGNAFREAVGLSPSAFQRAFAR